jgi:hypothetical protein
MRQGKEMFRTVLRGGHVALVAIASLLLVFGTALAASPAVPTAEGTAPVPPWVMVYELAKGSDYYQGCVGPCMCPVQQVGAITGTFDLSPLSPTPLFTRYSVTDIHWTVVDAQGHIVHKITGNGIYEIGGEVARMQQMTLFLSVDGQKPVTFDSGLVPEQTQFPDISIKVAHGTTCYQVWMTLNANPK